MNSDLIHFVLALFCSLLHLIGGNGSAECVYQMDLKNNRVKITCGEGAVLHIVDQHGNTLLTGETSNRVQDTPIVFQLNRSSISSLNDEASKATKKLSDASKLLRKIRGDLNDQSENLINLTNLLQRGDEELKKDLQLLKHNELNSPLAKEALVAAFQNQYNFLRMGLLSQNTYLNELIRTTARLTTSIMKTARGARGVGDILDLRADAMNETLYNITKLMPGRFEHGAFFGEKTVFCPQELKRISTKGTSVVCGVEEGTVMVDPYSPDNIWVMYGYNNVNQITLYESLKSLKFELVNETYELPFSCVGTGHAVYRDILYCQKMFTTKIVKYSLKASRWLAERQLEHIGRPNAFPYQFGKQSDMDFAVDEKGLWLIYATNSSRGNIVISKVNEEDLSFDKTWVTNIMKKDVANAFVICGVLYAIDSYVQVPTYVKYVFDTNTSKQKTLGPKALPFRNAVNGNYARVYALDYSPSDKALYSWNNGKAEVFPVSFSSATEP